MFKLFYFLFCLFTFTFVKAQDQICYSIFKNEPINFNGKSGNDTLVKTLESGRIIYKKVTVPAFKKGTDVNLTLMLRSNGDRWDKSGSCFVITNPQDLSLLGISKSEQHFPKESAIGTQYKGVKATSNYKPAIELLRFMTPFGVGHYSADNNTNRKPVYIPKWENKVVWHTDISHLNTIVTNTFYIGVWVDTWTPEGYTIDLDICYSSRPLQKPKVVPLVNTISYVSGQTLPDFFAHEPLEHLFELKHDVKNATLYYTTTGHGGHSGGDEFTKIKNSVFIDKQHVLDTIPWRDDCASFRRFNPTSGVWLKKDSASYIDFESRRYKTKDIEERLASSDLSRSNWCPGSLVKPFAINLGDLKKGTHHLKITIPATPATGDKLNHWLVSAYLTYLE